MVAITVNTAVVSEMYGSGILVLIDVCETQSSAGPSWEAAKGRNNGHCKVFPLLTGKVVTAKFYSPRPRRNFPKFVGPLLFAFIKCANLRSVSLHAYHIAFSRV